MVSRVTLRSVSHHQQMLRMVAERLGHSDLSHKLLMVTSDNVGTNADHLWLMSSWLRSLLGSIRSEEHLIILPDFTSEELCQAMPALQFPQHQQGMMVFNGVTKNILEILGVDIDQYALHDEGRNGFEAQPEMEETKLKCIYCPEQFIGEKLERKLRLHLITSHYENEIEKEVSKYFGSSDKCKKCEKIQQTISSKRIHLSYKHSSLVGTIGKIIEKIHISDNRHEEHTKNVNYHNECEKTDKMETDDDNTDHDIQNQLIMANQNFSDSESEDEEASVDKDEMYLGVQNILLQDQNLDDTDSDSDEENFQPGNKEKLTTLKNNQLPFEEEDISAKINEEIKNQLEKSAKGYICKVCGKTGRMRTTLIRHIETHLEGYSHPCTQCKAVMPTRNAQKQHIRTKHKNKN